MRGLSAFDPVRPLFLGLYLAPPVCELGAPCASGNVRRRQRLIFWLAAIPLLGLVSFPWYAPLFY